LKKKIIDLISEATGIPSDSWLAKIPQDVGKQLHKLGAGHAGFRVTTTPEHLDYYRGILDPMGVKQYAPLFGKRPHHGT
jgi:hypothetical protein